MARIRTIKPGFFRSHDVTPLSYRARLTWIGLWTYVDDEGRGKDDARIIKGDIWTLEDEVTWQDVEADLTELSRSAHVTRYTVGERHFLAIPKWLEHQVISRPTASKFPGPTPASIRDAPPITDDSVSTHGANTAGTGNREQGSGTGNRELSPLVSALFESAWSHWPKKTEKDPAREKFKSVARTLGAQEIHDHIVLFGDAYSATTDRQYVPGLGTWLNRKRWTDELPAGPTSGSTRGQENLAMVAKYAALEQLGIDS